LKGGREKTARTTEPTVRTRLKGSELKTGSRLLEHRSGGRLGQHHFGIRGERETPALKEKI